jgi:hypothetical protein
MKRVDVFMVEPTGHEYVIMAFGWDGKTISVIEDRMNGLASFVLKKGISGMRGKKFSAKDGEKFLENLQYAYSSGYRRATKPYEWKA